MSGKDFSNQIRINSPCNQDWDSMFGNDRVRFCEHCQLSVHNLDLTSRKQLRRLIARANGRLCVTYLQPAHRQSNGFVSPVLHKIGRRTSVIAASAFSAGLSLSTAVATTSNLNRPAVPHAIVSTARLASQFADGDTATLRGYVFDPAGAVIPNANVVLTNSETNEQRYSGSNDDGEYCFNELKPGRYQLRIERAGFATCDVNITVSANDNTRMDQTLSVAPITEQVEVRSGEVRTAGGAALVTPDDPLVKAAMEDNLEALTEVLVTRPDPNVRDRVLGSTALEFAVRNGNREMVQVLLSAKVDVNATDGDGQTVLMMLSEKVTSEIVWDLINAGAKVNHRDNEGDTALISVAYVNNVEALKTLLDAGAKVNASNKDGETALMNAAANGFVNNVRTLLLAGADVNARDKDGKTALTRALDNHEAAVARLLKAHGAIEFEEKEKQ